MAFVWSADYVMMQNESLGYIHEQTVSKYYLFLLVSNSWICMIKSDFRSGLLYSFMTFQPKNFSEFMLASDPFWNCWFSPCPAIVLLWFGDYIPNWRSSAVNKNLSIKYIELWSKSRVIISIIFQLLHELVKGKVAGVFRVLQTPLCWVGITIYIL